MTDTSATKRRGKPARDRSLSGEALVLLGRSPMVWIALAVLSVLLVMAVAPWLFTSEDPRHCELLRARKPPQPGHWFGFDIQGCDVFARTIYGARASLAVSFLATAGSTLIGGIVGLTAGFYGGSIDAALSRVTDVVLGLPTLLGAIVILATLGSAQDTGAMWPIVRLAFVLSILGWATESRLMRGSVLQTKQAEYVRAARAAGAGNFWIATRHVLPNSMAPLLVMATLSLGGYVGTEATLSFLGLGLQAPVISWGTAISDAQPYLASAPHMLLYPSLMLIATVLTLVLLGEAVRRAFDPRSR